MTIEVPETMPCPLCGGEIRRNARLCKHCHKRLDGEAPTAVPTAPAPPDAARYAAVHRDLREFILERDVLGIDRFDRLAAANPTDNALELLGRAATDGQLTRSQVDSLSAAFRASQEANLARILSVAQSRSLVTAPQAEQASTAFREIVFRRTPGDFVVEGGLLTPEQLTAIGTSPVQAAGGLRRRWKDPDFRTRLLAGPALAMVIALFATWVDNSTRGRAGWAFAILLLPIAASASVRREAATPGAKAKWAGATLVVALFAALFFDGLNVGRPPPTIEPRCSMDGNGDGVCVFSNHFSRTAHSCGRIVAECRNAGSRESLTICSGNLDPNRVTRRSFEVPEFDRIRARATPWGGDWRSFCQFEWVQE